MKKSEFFDTIIKVRRCAINHSMLIAESESMNTGLQNIMLEDIQHVVVYLQGLCDYICCEGKTIGNHYLFSGMRAEIENLFIAYMNNKGKFDRNIGDKYFLNIGGLRNNIRFIDSIFADKSGSPQHQEAGLPDELKTDKAKECLQKAVEGGLLKEDYTPADQVKTKPQKALLAEVLGESIGLRYRFKPFEALGGIKGLSKARYKSREYIGGVKGDEPIRAVFPEKKK